MFSSSRAAMSKVSRADPLHAMALTLDKGASSSVPLIEEFTLRGPDFRVTKALLFIYRSRLGFLQGILGLPPQLQVCKYFQHLSATF